MRTIPLLLMQVLLLVPVRAQAAADAEAAFRARDWQRAAALYAQLAHTDPNVLNCYRLGYCLHLLGRLDEALAWDERAAALGAEDPKLAATAAYNVACVHALQGRTDAAFAALRRAAERGFRRVGQLQRDPDLEPLRDDPRFAPLIAEIEDMADLVLVVVHDGVETLDFAGPVQVFASARDALGNPAFRVRFVAPSKQPVQPQNWRTTLLPDFGIDDCPTPKVLVVPGGDTGVLDEDPTFVAWLARTAPACDHLLSVCSGAYALARAGLLDGLRATTHHGSRPVLARQYPAIEVVDAKVVDADATTPGRVITAAGVSSGIDGALAVVQLRLGVDRAVAVARYMEYEWQPPPPAARETAAEPLFRAAVAAASGPRPAALAAVEKALAAGACPTRTLIEPAFQPLRTDPKFRAAIGRAARQSASTVVPAGEPGTPLFVDGSITDATGAPVEGALVYLWHTDAGGTYTGDSMDEANPRLFGYVRSDANGVFSVRTIRPAAYRGQEGRIEVHVHGLVTTTDGRRYAARLGFTDDPFWAGRTAPDWAAAVTIDADGAQHVAWRIQLDERARR